MRRDSHEVGLALTDPSDPRPLVLPKGHLPRGFQRLKELIRLEKGAQQQRIQQTKGNERKEDRPGGESKASRRPGITPRCTIPRRRHRRSLIVSSVVTVVGERAHGKQQQ